MYVDYIAVHFLRLTINLVLDTSIDPFCPFVVTQICHLFTFVFKYLKFFLLIVQILHNFVILQTFFEHSINYKYCYYYFFIYKLLFYFNLFMMIIHVILLFALHSNVFFSFFLGLHIFIFVQYQTTDQF